MPHGPVGHRCRVGGFQIRSTRRVTPQLLELVGQHQAPDPHIRLQHSLLDLGNGETLLVRQHSVESLPEQAHDDKRDQHFHQRKSAAHRSVAG